MWLGELITEQRHRQRLVADHLRRHRRRHARRARRSSSARRQRRAASSGSTVAVHGRCSSSATIAAICFFERAHRRIPVQYTKRQVGRKMYQGAQSYLPLKINVSGVIPPIFASSILMFPAQIANMSGSALDAGVRRRCCTRPTGATT